MNILVLTSEYPYKKDSNSDRTKVVGYFTKEWVKQGHKVVVIVNSSTFPNFYYSIGEKLIKFIARFYSISRCINKIWTNSFFYIENGVYVQNIPIHKCYPHGCFSKKTLNKQLRAIENTLQEQDFKPDIVTGHWVNPQIKLIPFLANKYGAKSAFVFHADYKYKICKKFHVQKYIDQIDHIGFRSKHAAETALKYLNIKDKPFVAASGIPDAFIQSYYTMPQKEYAVIKIITAARLLEYKKIDVIISATENAFSDHPFDLIIAGDGPLKKQLENQAIKSKFSKHIHLIGETKREDLQDLMSESDIFALISLHETFGLVYLEAMLHGCIVIASRFGGVDGIIQDGINGFLCEEGNEQELTTIFKKILSLSREDRIKIGEKARNTAIQFTEDKVARDYINHILE